MKVFYDAEFNEKPNFLEPISIGLVREDGFELYIELQFDPNNSNPWVRENVWPHLLDPPRMTCDGWQVANTSREEAAELILEFCGPEPEFWTYYGAYDWVALCWLFGTMMDLPEGWPMFPMDLKQCLAMAGNPEVPDIASECHNALDDARFNKRLWEWINGWTP